MFGILFGQVLNCDSRCYLSGPWEATDVLHENSYYIVLSMVSSTLHFVLGIVLSLGRLYRIADTYFILGIVLSLGRFCHIADSYRPQGRVARMSSYDITHVHKGTHVLRTLKRTTFCEGMQLEKICSFWRLKGPYPIRRAEVEKIDLIFEYFSRNGSIFYFVFRNKKINS